eukprot:s2731_g13.t2
MRLLIPAFLFLQGAALRDSTDTTGSGCHVVEGAVKRKGFHWLQKCKCAAPDAVLTKSCGVEEGERKFDVTRIQLQTEVRSSVTLRANTSICARSRGSGGIRGSRGRGIEGNAPSNGMSDDDSTKAMESEADKSEMDQEKVCARWGAVPREGLFHKKGCKCEEDWTLSAECGDRRLLRKFRPEDQDAGSLEWQT